MNVEDIRDSVDSALYSNFASVSDRYYDHKYCTQFSTNEKNLDQRVSFHTNRICLISLADYHPIIRHKKKISKINCLVEKKMDRLNNTVTGRGKRGAQKLDPDSLLCYIECDDNETYPVYSCIQGKLIEINENLLEEPNLLVEKPVNEGYIALLLPVLQSYETFKNTMLTKEEYLSKRSNTSS